MTDLRKTQAEWDRFLGRELVGMFVAALAELEALEDRYARQRTLVVVLNDTHGNSVPGGVKLSGADLGVNTSPEGLLFVRVEGSANPRTVSLYRAGGAAAQDLVARGRGSAGSTIVLGERNGSDLGGSWELPVAVTEDLTDTLRLALLPDWRARALQVWDGSYLKDADSRRVFTDALDAISARLGDARRIMLEALRAFATQAGGRGAEFLGAASSALVTDARVRDPSGAVVRRRTGFLPGLARAMRAETLAGPQSVAERVVEASAAQFAASNRGKGRVAAHVARESCPEARWTFRCLRGVETGHGGAEEFECAVKVTGEDRTFRFAGVRVKQSFAGPQGIGPFSIERVYTKAGDPVDETLGAADRFSLTGERRGNTEAGVLHWRVEERGAVWDVSFFRSASRAHGDLVAKVEGVVAQAPFVAVERNASGLSVSGEVGPQPRNGEGTLDCNFFRVENAQRVPDSFVIETRVARSGKVQRLLARHLGGDLPSRPSGQASVSDTTTRAGTLATWLAG